MGRQPLALSQAMSPDTAAKMRALMASVVERGTAAGAFGTLVRKAGLTAGGKTGTAQRDVPMIDPKTGKPVTYVDSRGRTRIKMDEKHRIDSWFIGFAPVENPKIAWAVVVEGGGYGARRLGADRGQSAGASEEPWIIERRDGSAEAHAGARKRSGAAVNYAAFPLLSSEKKRAMFRARAVGGACNAVGRLLRFPVRE